MVQQHNNNIWQFSDKIVDFHLWLAIVIRIHLIWASHPHGIFQFRTYIRNHIKSEQTGTGTRSGCLHTVSRGSVIPIFAFISFCVSWLRCVILKIFGIHKCYEYTKEKVCFYKYKNHFTHRQTCSLIKTLTCLLWEAFSQAAIMCVARRLFTYSQVLI